MDINHLTVQTIHADWLLKNNLSLDVLRLDQIHPVISGNKWYKLKYYLQDATASKKDAVATFGGAWSNHIVATAFACKEAGLKSIGIIRGERPSILSDTLTMSEEYGMELHFVSRQAYREKEEIAAKYKVNNWYWISEGGYGQMGAKGAAEILQSNNMKPYSHIIASVGTGTMLAGILLSAEPQQHIIGISSLKGNLLLQEQILNLTKEKKLLPSIQIIHDYHFGGYAKHPKQLIDFMNHVYVQHHLPLDIVYTAKTFYAIHELAAKGFFSKQSRLLMIHSGGLQGNNSLQPDVLVF